MMNHFAAVRRTCSFLACAALVPVAGNAAAQLTAEDMPGTAGAPAKQEPQEVVIDVTATTNKLPVLLVLPHSPADRKLASDVAHEIQLTGLFEVRGPSKVHAGQSLDEPSHWPPLTTAAVEVRTVRRPGGFPLLRSLTKHVGEPDVLRTRGLVAYPGSGGTLVPTLTDAILEDVLGYRTHMSGWIVLTDASTRGERSVRIVSPDGKRGRRVSGFGSLSRGADFGPGGRVWYASEDEAGKLRLFMERQTAPVSLGLKGYVQGVSFSPNGKHMVLSLGQGRRVTTWQGASPKDLAMVELPANRTSLSPSIDDQGHVLRVIGPTKGPFSVFMDNRRLTSPGSWAALPSFCSTIVEQRIVYMARAGRSWSLKIKSLTSGAVRTIATRAMSPACSPDGRTVAFYSSGQRGKGAGVYLVSDLGGLPRKVWSGQAAGLRWRGGERLPRPQREQVVHPDAQDAGVAGCGDAGCGDAGVEQ